MIANSIASSRSCRLWNWKHNGHSIGCCAWRVGRDRQRRVVAASVRNITLEYCAQCPPADSWHSLWTCLRNCPINPGRCSIRLVQSRAFYANSESMKRREVARQPNPTHRELARANRVAVLRPNWACMFCLAEAESDACAPYTVWARLCGGPELVTAPANRRNKGRSAA
jgi:hypothetical protein